MSDFAGERTYTQEEVDKLLSETQQITCKTCSVENVPDWKDGDCITCARYKILGSETQLTLQEKKRELIIELSNHYYEEYRYDRPNDSTEQLAAFARDIATNEVDELLEACKAQALTSLKGDKMYSAVIEETVKAVMRDLRRNLSLMPRNLTRRDVSQLFHMV